MSMNRHILSVGAVMACLAFLGGGCLQQTTSTPPTSTSSATTSSSTSTNPLVGKEGSLPRFLSLQGVLPQEQANVQVMLNLGSERATGRYELAGSRGSIYGVVSSTLPDPIQLSFILGDEDTLTFRGKYDALKGELVGMIKSVADQEERSIVLAPYREKGSAHIEVKRISRQVDVVPTGSCRTSLEYPVIEADESVSVDQAMHINQQIRRFLGETSTTTLESLVATTQQECLDTQKEMQSDGSPTSSGMNDYEYETSFSVTRNERGLLSIVYLSYYYTGGAHPNSIQSSQVFDLSTGKQLAITDLIQSDSLSEWIRAEQTALLRSE